MRFAIIVTLAVVGLFVAVCVPNLHTAMQRSKQKVTSARLRDWAVELEAYANECKEYPELAPGPVERVRTLIANPKLVAQDAWGRDILYHGSHDHYLLHSLGRDGKNDFVPPGHPTTSFDGDLVYADGMFLQYPEGIL